MLKVPPALQASLTALSWGWSEAPTLCGCSWQESILGRYWDVGSHWLGPCLWKRWTLCRLSALDDRSTGRGLWEKGQLRERWPRKVPFASDPSHQPSISTSLQGKGGAQQPQETFPCSHGASDGCFTPWLPHSHCGLHTHACHVMNPSGGFRHGGCKMGCRPPELWVFPPMDVSWTLAPAHMTYWSHRNMEWAQLPPASNFTLLRLEKTIINKDAGGHLASLACFLGVDLLFLVVLQLSWGPLQTVSLGSLLAPWTF